MMVDRRTLPLQSTTPSQSPVKHALPPVPVEFVFAGPVPSALKLQFVRPQIRPCQSALTVKLVVLPGEAWKPPNPGPVPACVKMAG